MTITASIIDKNTIKPTDFSNPVNIRKEMVQNPEESLWIHADHLYERRCVRHLQETREY